MPRWPSYGRESIPNLPPVQSQKWVEAIVNQGMVTNIDPADIPPAALQLAKNAIVRNDKTSRRPGSVLLTPVKPNATPVLKYAFIKKQDGVGYTLRFTPDDIHYIAGAIWTPIPGVLTGTEADRFNTAVVLNELVFSNNGADPIQKVDFDTLTFAQLGNAPAYRFICGFFNRVVGANLRGVNEVQIGWSGDAAVEEWDPLVDESAGFGPLVESPADLSDFITGLFSWTNSMVVLREKSVWVATKQPIAQNPFNFHAVIPGIGCDCPYSGVNIGDALAWFDQRTQAVYAYSPGGGFEVLSGNIENEIARNIDDVELVFGGYNPRTHEYTVYVPMVASSYVQAWTYSRRNKAWTYNEYYDLTGVDDVELGTGGIIIDDLGGTIDDLEGTIDELSPSQITIANHTYGRGDGSGAVLDPDSSFDAPHADFPIGIPYTTELVSKVFTIPENDVYIAEIRIEIKAQVGGSFTIEYSRTGGEGLDPWRVAKTIDPQILNVSRIIKYRKLIRCRRFAWRLVAEQGLFDIMSYEIHVYQAGLSNK